MEQLLHQLETIILGALPTAIIVFIFYLLLRWSFFRPLERVLSERERAIEGTRQAAAQLLAEAEAKTQQYESAIRQARVEIYQQRELARRQALDERMRILRETRERANQMIREAKMALLRDVEQAKKELEKESARLANDIARLLLAPAAGAASRERGDTA